MADHFDDWAAILNPDIVRTKLISAGLFLIGHEMLLDSITRHPLSFFADHWTPKGPTPGAKYASEVLALDPKRKDDPLRGSIAWLRMMSVITADDEATIRRITDARNEIAHEMTAMISASRMPNFADHFHSLTTLTEKIEKWWIVNVEIDTDLDLDAREIDVEGIVSGTSLVMQLLSRVALGDDDEAWEFHREFAKQGKDGQT